MSRNPFTVRRLLTIVGLVAAWCALWGSVSVANVLSGTILSILLLSASFGTSKVLKSSG